MLYCFCPKWQTPSKQIKIISYPGKYKNNPYICVIRIHMICRRRVLVLKLNDRIII